MNTLDIDNDNTLSFNEIINLPFIRIKYSNFERTDTGEFLGSIWAKYPKHSKITATAYGGIIEFYKADENYITKIYGNELTDLDKKIFKGYK